MTRIAVAGFLHETNTFAPTKATYEDFCTAAPRAMTQGEVVLQGRCATSIWRSPASSRWLKAKAGSCCRRSPAAATPSAHVTKDAFERIAAMIARRPCVGRARSTACILDLHGAMVTEHLDDGEGEVLARVRKLVGTGRAGGHEPRPARQHHARR